MKLQNLTVIFIIIAIPIILILSYYISLQVDTINMQTSYNTKLLDSTKKAIDAFEINTVEWNDAYSTTADSKRRDVMASINTFVTSFANNTGMAGSNKEDILAYIPAIAYTLYDGYYIYSPSEVKETVKNENGVTVFYTEKLFKSGENPRISGENYNSDDEGKILYVPEGGDHVDGQYIDKDGDPFNYTLEYDNARTEWKHILKPFSSYSARYVNGNTDIVVNYTLDNYITIYGTIDGTENIIKSGYLINSAYVDVPNNSIDGIKSENDKEIEPEELKEMVLIKDSAGNYSVGEYTYVYAEDNTKVYFDAANSNRPFQVNSNGNGIYLDQLVNGLSGVKYKKLLIKTGEETYETIYQALVKNADDSIQAGRWYKADKTTEITDFTNYGGANIIEKQQDVSAINYYVESLTFTNWVNNYLGGINVINMDSREEDKYPTTGSIFSGNYGNDSVFYNHKREVIKQTIISNLNQAITSYSRNNTAGEFYLPVLSETDWDQILTNVSIVTFAQEIPIGIKKYNNYAIATSTVNKEYVDPNEIYLKQSSDDYYHKIYCNKLTEINNIIAYRNIDYRVRSYTNILSGTTSYYYKQITSNTYNQECYYCLVQSSLFEESDDAHKGAQQTAYDKALARERWASHEFRNDTL